METEGSLPHSQQPATCPYREPYQSSPRAPIPRLEDHGRFAEKETLLFLQGIKPRLLGRPVHSRVTIPTTLSV
jgi:hypothetical protein